MVLNMVQLNPLGVDCINNAMAAALVRGSSGGHLEEPCCDAFAT